MHILQWRKISFQKIIEAQSAEVDTISGATFSSTGIKNAAEQALEQAVK
ncbi:MAG: FMN-binding protein [Mediterraneibacter faecis]